MEAHHLLDEQDNNLFCCERVVSTPNFVRTNKLFQIIKQYKLKIKVRVI